MRAIDLFAGAGGWTEGATQAGARVLVAANHWPLAVATHQRNHPETHHLCQDVALLDATTLPAHDLLLASPACQGHSRARGKDQPHHDISRSTAWAVIDIAEVARPRMIAVENVIEFRDKWALYPLWRAALERLGYGLSENVLDAADFGVPQERVRLFVVGVLNGKAPQIVPPRVDRVPASSFIDLGAGRWSPVDRRGRAPNTLRRIARARAEIGPRFLVPFYGSTKTGRELSRPIGTITTHDRYAIVDGDRMRMLTVAENKAAMGFPAGYVIEGNNREQVHQIGNAVSPPVARGIVRQLAGTA